MTDLLKVEGFSNLRKDPSSGGVVNVDRKSYEAHRLQKTILQQKYLQQKTSEENISSMQTEINTIKSDIQDIRSMLIELLNKGN